MTSFKEWWVLNFILLLQQSIDTVFLINRTGRARLFLLGLTYITECVYYSKATTGKKCWKALKTLYMFQNCHVVKKRRRWKGFCFLQRSTKGFQRRYSSFCDETHPKSCESAEGAQEQSTWHAATSADRWALETQNSCWVSPFAPVVPHVAVGLRSTLFFHLSEAVLFGYRSLPVPAPCPATLWCSSDLWSSYLCCFLPGWKSWNVPALSRGAIFTAAHLCMCSCRFISMERKGHSRHRHCDQRQLHHDLYESLKLIAQCALKCLDHMETRSSPLTYIFIQF